MTSTAPHPPPSAVTALINTTATTKSTNESLALQVLHNLRHQHRWTDLKLYTVSSPTTPTSSPTRSRRSKSPSGGSIFLVSGVPPRSMYIHPDLQKELLKRNADAADLPVPREWVLPASAGEKWTLKRFAWIFDGMSEREPIKVPATAVAAAQDIEQNASSEIEGGSEQSSTTASSAASTSTIAATQGFEWKDAKRVILAILAHNGMGGDGTIAYYVMQEGEVKPRQNG